MFLSDDKQADIFELLSLQCTSTYLDDILNINYIHFDNMVNQIYPAGLQLNTVKIFDTKASFLDLQLTISNDTVSTKIYDKRDDFDF